MKNNSTAADEACDLNDKALPGWIICWRPLSHSKKGAPQCPADLRFRGESLDAAPKEF